MTINPQINGASNSRKTISINMDNRAVAHSERTSWDGTSGSVGKANGGPTVQPRYPHIKDLQARAEAITREMVAFTPVS